MATRKPKGDSPAMARYTPPANVCTFEAGLAGITGTFLMRVPNLYGAGDLRLLDRACVAVVGSRDASVEGQKRAAQLARELVRAHVVIMSGLAAGIDQAAHRSAIEHGGRTIAVIGTPLEKAYPKEHAALQEQIYREHLLLSPFAPGSKTFPSAFPERNRVMARIAAATVIIEAGDTSGSLHQAAESIQVGHPVFIAQSVLETPGITWPERFINQPGVHVLRSVDDVISLALERP